MPIIGKIIGHLLAKKLKEKKKETGEPQTEDQEAKTRRVLLEAVRDSLAYKAQEAGKKITEIKEKTDDPEQRKVAEKIYNYIVDTLMGYKYIAAPAAAEILEKKLYKDPKQVLKVLLQTHYYVLREAYKNIPGIHKATEEEHRKYGKNAIEPYWAWGGIESVLNALYYATHDERYREIEKQIREMRLEVKARRLEATTDPDNVLREIINKHAQRMIGEPVIPEEEEEEEKKETLPGMKTLAHPDRYPSVTQKLLLKALVLGRLQEERGGVDRNLYRAIHNLLSSPLTGTSWYPFLSEWFKALEGGKHISPLTALIEKLPVNPGLKVEAYKYLRKIEEGKPLSEIPPEEKEAFRQVMEKIKEEVWRNRDHLQEVADEIVYASDTNTEDVAKAIVGLLHDLTLLYTGEKSLKELGIEREAIQIYHTIKNLKEKGRYIDSHELSQTLSNIIEQHVHNPLLKRAYIQAIQHFEDTHHQLPRDKNYLKAIIEKEKELEEKLAQLSEGDLKLAPQEIRHITSLYRALMLLTPYPTLTEIQQFYKDLTANMKVKVADKEFVPVHGPLAEDIASTFSIIRRKPREERAELISREIAGYEPTLYVVPHIEKKVESILSTTFTNVVPREKHEKFLKHIERAQTRRPIE